MEWRTETFTAWVDTVDGRVHLYYVTRALKEGTYDACVSRSARPETLAKAVTLGFAITRCEQHAAVHVLCAFFARCWRESAVLAEAV